MLWPDRRINGTRCENLDDYQKGGYHPVHLGDFIPSARPKYRVLLKLGHGTASTVWLAEVLEPSASNSALVSWKVVKAEVSEQGGESEEIHVLEALKATNTHGDHTHVLLLQNHFQIHGPNGTHNVFITDIIAPLSVVLQSLPNGLDVQLLKILTRQLICAVDYLHGRGIVHEDLHLGNIGIVLPPVTEKVLQEELLWYICSDEEFLPSFAQDPESQMSTPRYLLSSTVFQNYIYRWCKSSSFVNVKLTIFDFGNSFREYITPRPKTFFLPPRCNQAPEMILKEEWGMMADIWALGCTLYEMAYGSPMFSSLRGGLAQQIYDQVQYAGPLPQQWKAKWVSTPELEFTAKQMPMAVIQQRDKYYSEGSKLDANVISFWSLLQCMMKMEPHLRQSASQLLKHEWFAEVNTELKIAACKKD